MPSFYIPMRDFKCIIVYSGFYGCKVSTGLYHVCVMSPKNEKKMYRLVKKYLDETLFTCGTLSYTSCTYVYS